MALAAQNARMKRARTLPLYEWEQTEQPGYKFSRPRQKQVRLREQQIDQLVERYQAGASCRSLAREFGVNESTVFGHLKRRGVPRRAFRKLHGELLEQAVKLYTNGASLSTTAKVIGLSKDATRAGLVNSGIKIRD